MRNKLHVLDHGYVILHDVMGSDLTVVNAARCSYDKESNELSDKDKRLIRFLAREGHTSPFRHATAQFEVYAPLMVARQWWKYVVGSDHTMDAWNESCFPANQEIRRWGQGTITVGELYERAKKGLYHYLPQVRSVNSKGEIVKNKVKDVWKTGRAKVYRVTSELGFHIETTDNHRYLTPDGYRELKYLKPGDYVMMNGIPAYKDKDWLQKHYVEKELTQKEIAEMAGCSHHTIRKWIRHYGLQQNPVERMHKYNRKYGVFGKGLTKETSEVIRKRSIKSGLSQRGKKKNRPFRTPRIANTGHWQARQIYTKDKCAFCNETNSLEIHHIDRNPLNNEPDNIMIVCSKHHHMVHGNHVLMVAHPVRIQSIEYVGEMDVYDIEMENEPNLVVNQFVVHNSRRYITEEPVFYVPKADLWRSAPANSKQGSGDVVNWELGHEAMMRLFHTIDRGMENYEWALENGICAEQARLFLPAYGMYVRWRWTASLQSIAHFLNQRLEHDAQKEIQEYAQAVYELIKPKFPVSIEELVAKEGQK